MPDNFAGGFPISVSGAANPVMGVNGQGVCGVNISFDHEYIGDLTISLTSPSGQTVTLVGPLGFWGPTDGSSWNISFVPCGTAASPDGGFSSNFNNNQPWGLFGDYTGSYHPFGGCLESLTGPVNGTWTLSVTDGQANDEGNFYDYEIIFCDPTGINCVSCDAAAGNLLQPDVVACEGASTLDLNLPPTYSGGQTAPGAGYSYTYVVGGPGGVIQDYMSDPNLTTFNPGTYTVCGMSYLTNNAGSFPAAGSTTIAALTGALNGPAPPFCGKITTNCVNVVINPGVPDENVMQTICAPQVFPFHGQNFNATGVYTLNLVQNGCPYTATLDLTVIPLASSAVQETVCEGECSQTPGFGSFCSTGVYQQSFQTASGCDSLVTLNLTVSAVNANIVPPLPLTCTNPIATLSGAGSTAGAGVSYAWTASNGGNVSGNPFALVTQGNQAGDYQLRVCRLSAGGVVCCDSATVTLAQDLVLPDAPVAVAGNANPCQGATLVFSATPVPGATVYNWTLPSGATINGAQTTPVINTTWNNAAAGQICVTASNACGASQPTCLDVSPNAPPVLAPVTGNGTVCRLSDENYNVPAVTNALTYTWTVPPGAFITAGQGTNEISVNWGQSNGGQVCCTAVNACGPSQPVCMVVATTGAPQAPVVQGNATACAGATQTFTVPAVTGVNSYTWDIVGGTIDAGAGTNSVTVTWDASATSGQICAIAVGDCGPSQQFCRNITLSPAPPMPVVAGDTTLCAGASSAYSIQNVPGSSGYTWTVPAGANIASGQNSTSIVVNWGNSTGGNVCVSASSTCGAGPQACYNVKIKPYPTANAGPSGNICGLSFGLNAVPSIAGSTGIWSQISGPGSASFANANAATTNVSASLNGQYIFRWIESNGSCPDTAETTVNFNATPQAGQATALCDGANENYTVSFSISGGLAPYTVSGAGSISGNVFTSGPIQSAMTYTFAFADANGCTATAVTGSHNCNCSTNAGTMNLTQLSACEGQTIAAQHNNNAQLDANDIGVFMLHTASGTSLGQIFGQSTTGQFAMLPGMQFDTVYYVSYVVGNNNAGTPAANDACRSVAQGQPLVFRRNPIADAGLDADTCGSILMLNAAPSVGFGTWTLENGPTGGNLAFSNSQSATSSATATQSGTYKVVWSLDNFGCTASDEIELEFFDNPNIGQIQRDCDAANENYTVSIPLSGGTAPYFVNGNPVSGNTFVSEAIQSGTTFNFAVTDANGCPAPAVTGNHNCNCSTSAGTMNLQQITACEGLSISATHNADATLDGNDTFAFVLHDAPGTTLGQIFDQNKTGLFAFQPGMIYGQTYYVSYIAGTAQNGQPSPSDGCFSVAQGQPVVFYQNPVADAGVDDAVCGLSIGLGASSGTSGQWALTQSPLGGSAAIAAAQSPTSTLTATAPGIYKLTWTLDNNGCTDSDEVQITFNPLPSVGLVERDCDAANENYTVTIPLSGGTPPFLVGANPVSGNVFVSNPLTNGATYNFSIEDANGCTTSAVTGSFNCNCATNAGTMNLAPLTACEGLTVTAQHNGDQSFDANDVGRYILHDGSGNALGQIFAQNATGVFGIQPGLVLGQTYFISFVAGNDSLGLPNVADPCFSVAQGQPVVFAKNPTPDAGADAGICGQSIDLQANSTLNAGLWTKISGPGNSSFASASDPASTVSVSATGLYQFQWEETSPEGCKGNDLVQIAFNPSPATGPATEDCDATNDNFTVTFQISGGTAPFSVNGAPLAGNTFTSAPLANNAAYNFVATDANGCESPALTGSHDCNCTTSAGASLTYSLAACEGQTLVAQHLGGQVLDGNDVSEFWLHDGTASQLGQILARNSTGIFGFQNGTMTYGTTYYVVFAVGNSLGGSPDPADGCFSMTTGQPFVWHPEVSAVVAPTGEICNSAIYGSSLDFGQFVSGGDLTGTWSGPSGLGNGTLPVLDFDGAMPGVYNFQYQTQAAILPCENKIYTLELTVKNCQCPPLAILPAPKMCNTGGSLDLSTLIGNSAPGTWTLTQTPSGNNPAALNGTVFNANNADSGNYELTYALTDVPPAGCPSSAVQNIRVENAVEAGTVSGEERLCEGESKTIQLASLLVGADAGGAWTETSTVPSTGGAFNAGAGTFQTDGQKPGLYTYMYKVSGELPCPDDEATVRVRIHPRPKADAGLDQSIDCEKPTSSLGGNATSNGPNLVFEWSNAGAPIAGATSPTIEVSAGGIFQLIVRDTATGCFDRDEVRVEQDSEIPVANEIEISPLLCFGDENASIAIGGITGGTPPYRFSLNGGAFGANSTFRNLTAGTYIVSIEDSHGCSWTSDELGVVEPTELTVELGPDIEAQLGDSITIRAEISIPQAAIDTLTWSILQNRVFAGLPFQGFTALKTQEFEITVWDTNGCVAKDRVLVKIDRKRHVYVPNIFYPESGSGNDVLTVFGGQDVIEIEAFEIFDRWGERMFGNYNFAPSDPAESWNGTFRDKNLNPGVYLWFAKVKFKDGKSELFTGDVTLKR